MKRKIIAGIETIFHRTEKKSMQDLGKRLFELSLKMIDDGRIEADESMKKGAQQLMIQLGIKRDDDSLHTNC